MKTLLLMVASGMVFQAASAQSETETNQQTLWTPPKAACDAYNADREASQNAATSNYMQQTFDNTYTDESRETRLRDAVMPIICNPPTRSNDNDEE